MSTETPPEPRALRRFLARLALFGVVLALAAEVFFRSVIPAAESPMLGSDETLRLRRFDVNGPRDGVWTSGRRAEQRARWHVNAQGWNCPHDYEPDDRRERPALAFVGDSQFEGLYVEWADHIAAQVSAGTGGAFVSYSFASSGAKLSQYILIARHMVAENITPAVMVMLVNQGDFYQSLHERGGRAAVDQIRLTGEPGNLRELPPAPYAVVSWRRSLRESALFRYLLFNARLNPWQSRGVVEFAMREAGAQPEDGALADPLYVSAFDYTVAAIRKELPNTRQIFLIDADRARLYREARRPPPLGTSPLIAARCPELGCTFVDLTEAFSAAYLSDGRKLNFEHNFHWDAHGHAVAAEAVLAHLRAIGVVPP